jgi:hypothetical protein
VTTHNIERASGDAGNAVGAGVNLVDIYIPFDSRNSPAATIAGASVKIKTPVNSFATMLRLPADIDSFSVPGS